MNDFSNFIIVKPQQKSDSTKRVYLILMDFPGSFYFQLNTNEKTLSFTKPQYINVNPTLKL